MDTTALLLGLIIVGVAFYLIASPLVRPLREEAPEGGPESGEGPAERERESVFVTLGEIEFDYQMKKLSEPDYKSLQNTYKRQAVKILKSEEEEGIQPAGRTKWDEVSIEKDIELEIEAEIEADLSKSPDHKSNG